MHTCRYISTIIVYIIISNIVTQLKITKLQFMRWHFTVGRLKFFKGYKFCKWTLKGNLRKLFSWIYIGIFSSLCNPCHNIIISLIFSETNFVEVPKIHEICEFCNPQKRRPTVANVSTILSMYGLSNKINCMAIAGWSKSDSITIMRTLVLRIIRNRLDSLPCHLQYVHSPVVVQ